MSGDRNHSEHSLVRAASDTILHRSECRILSSCSLETAASPSPHSGLLKTNGGSFIEIIVCLASPNTLVTLRTRIAYGICLESLALPAKSTTCTCLCSVGGGSKVWNNGNFS